MRLRVRDLEVAVAEDLEVVAEGGELRVSRAAKKPSPCSQWTSRTSRSMVMCSLLAAEGKDMDVPALEVQRADVTKLEVDAIANAANTELKHGGGVAAAISRAGGAAVQRESDERAPIGLGDAVETTAGDMPARYVIHAATMELGGPTSRDIIDRATRSTLRRAEELGCRSLGLVVFGTGVGGFSVDEAAEVMVAAAREHDGGTLERVVFCVHGEQAGQAFEAAIAEA